jgi:hypothetical protein
VFFILFGGIYRSILLAILSDSIKNFRLHDDPEDTVCLLNVGVSLHVYAVLVACCYKLDLCTVFSLVVISISEDSKPCAWHHHGCY